MQQLILKPVSTICILAFLPKYVFIFLICWQWIVPGHRIFQHPAPRGPHHFPSIASPLQRGRASLWHGRFGWAGQGWGWLSIPSDHPIGLFLQPRKAFTPPYPENANTAIPWAPRYFCPEMVKNLQLARPKSWQRKEGWWKQKGNNKHTLKCISSTLCYTVFLPLKLGCVLHLWSAERRVCWSSYCSYTHSKSCRIGSHWHGENSRRQQ